ncbi:MAG: CIA30 family protein [Balneolaceae bacterium]|nr:CIA30 family protein [Balneolaceae bacterium]MCH8549682.1 CIA30 family protein [Balneolaceae bacterium]
MELLKEKQLITDFSNLARQRWLIINDGVMGGVSRSQFQISDSGTAVFLGKISLENNGGFASVKNHEPLNLAGRSAIHLRVLGDGKRYSFRFQTETPNGKINRFNYEQRFDTNKNEWQEISLNLEQFEAVYRGRDVEDAPSPDLSAIVRYGFLISDGQEGSFRLEVEKIYAT